jgi:hypothetical protein
VRHWADGGETKLSNLVSLCGFHHKLVHEGGFGVSVTDDGVFVFTRPDGRRIPECGRNPCTALEQERFSASASTSEAGRVSASASTSELGRFSGSASASTPRRPDRTLGMTSFEDALRFQIARLNNDVRIDTQTSRCKWRGERMDYDMAIEGMQFRDGRTAAAGALSHADQKSG